jgi:hypothetical protein
MQIYRVKVKVISRWKEDDDDEEERKEMEDDISVLFREKSGSKVRYTQFSSSLKATTRASRVERVVFNVQA